MIRVIAICITADSVVQRSARDTNKGASQLGNVIPKVLYRLLNGAQSTIQTVLIMMGVICAGRRS